jgi:sugar/nucleoside kinase (ribokinase family)
MHFLAVGDLMIDLTVSGLDHDATIALHAGGSALNAARAAVTRGVKATIVGRVGDDLAGHALSGFLADAGIAAELTVAPSARTGTFAIVDEVVRVDRGANAGDWSPPALPAADVALVSGYLSAATVKGIVGRLDAPLVALGVGRLREIPRDVGVVLASKEEARALTGLEDPAEAARRLSAGHRVACVTLGAEGALAAHPSGIATAAPERRYEGDPPGAGDAFAASFLIALAGGAPVDEALEAAQRPSAGFAM